MHVVKYQIFILFFVVLFTFLMKQCFGFNVKCIFKIFQVNYFVKDVTCVVACENIGTCIQPFR